VADAFVLPDLVGGGWRDLDFEPFRDGVEVCHLVRGEPAVAVLRYAPGAQVPRHVHRGLETILILQGSQRDERGVYGAGTVIFNTEGSEHAVASDDGCVVLVQWQRPVAFVGERE